MGFTTYHTYSSIIPGRTDCSEGYILWPIDSTCHRPFYRGPCGPDQILIDHQQGPYCEFTGTELEDETGEDVGDVDQNLEDNENSWSLGSVITQPIASPDAPRVVYSEDSWTLPKADSTLLTPEEENCLSRDQIWWPVDRQCYSLLSQGPCGSMEWLVLVRSGGRDQVVCQHRKCPCDPAMPEFCEVEVEDSLCQCRVALAAAQDGLCDAGEQLLVTPYGVGVCGCIVDPPHTPWPQDGRCYPVHSRGPCSKGFVLKLSHSSQEPACQPALCGEGQVLHEDGLCHQLGSQGPCESFHILSLSPDSLEPECILNTSKVKRVYDIIPNNRGLILDGPLARSMKVGNCKMDSRGKCRKSFYIKQKRGGKSISRNRNVRLYVKKRSPTKYLNWLKSFRKTRTN